MKRDTVAIGQQQYDRAAIGDGVLLVRERAGADFSGLAREEADGNERHGWTYRRTDEDDSLRPKRDP